MIEPATLEKLNALNLEGYDMIEKAYHIFDEIQVILAQERKSSRLDEESKS